MKNSMCGCEKIKQWTGVNTPALRDPCTGFLQDQLEITCFSSRTEEKAGPESFLELEFFVGQKSMSLCDSGRAASWADL